MSLRGTRALSRFFQATIRIAPEKRYSGVVDDVIPLPPGKENVFGPDFSSDEQERIWHYNTNLVFKEGEFLDMGLLDNKRRLLYTGKLFRQSDSTFERRTQVEIFVLLFDNYLVMTRPVGKRLDGKLQVYKRPIPLDLLAFEVHKDAAAIRVKRRSSIFFGRNDAVNPYLSTLGAGGTPDEFRGVFPLTINQEGSPGGSYTLYADTERSRSMWGIKLDEAIRLRQKSSQVFKMKVLNRESFVMKTGVSSGYLPKSRQFTKTINCVTPFTTRDGRDLTAIGCVEGLWIGDIRDPQTLHCVLPLQMVRQCVILEEFEIILLLVDNDLCAYDLESCVPSSTGRTAYYPPRKLNSKGEVSFFRVGTIDGDTYIVFSRRKRRDTVFKMVKVIRLVEDEPPISPSGTKPEWFCLYRDFSLPMCCTDVIFLHRSLVVLHHNGFSMLNPLDFHCVDMPLPAERNAEHRNLVKRRTSSQSLGIFRLQTEAFLLCYDRFGIYIDKHGNLINDRAPVEWEGVAECVSYHHPYVLLFSRGFVEIRHAVTGRLEQIIRGNSVRCVWEGGGTLVDDPNTGQSGQHLSIVGVTNTPAGLDELVVQSIFTLVPSKRSTSPTQRRHFVSVTERANTLL